MNFVSVTRATQTIWASRQAGWASASASQGFVTGAGTLGIVPLAPQNQGVENIFFNNFTIGSDPDRFYQINNNFELSDNFSKVVGNHTIKARRPVGLRPDQHASFRRPEWQL